MDLGNRLLTLRKQKGYSQEELALELNVSRQSVSKWEMNQSVPEMDKMILLSELYGVSLDYIVKGTDYSGHQTKFNPSIFGPMSLLVSVIGLIVALTLWFEYQNLFLSMIGFMIQLVACLIFIIGIKSFHYRPNPSDKLGMFMSLLYIPLSLLIRQFFSGIHYLVGLSIFWVIYIGLSLLVWRKVSKTT